MYFVALVTVHAQGSALTRIQFVRHAFSARLAFMRHTVDSALTLPPRMLPLKDAPDHHDAELVLKLYELRTDAVLRKSRQEISSKFFPTSFEDWLAVSKDGHPLNEAYRQVSSYWEMTYAMAKHGVIHSEFMLESCGEGMYLFAKVRPYLERFRSEVNPLAFQNAEWVAANTKRGQLLAERFAKRVATVLAAR